MRSVWISLCGLLAAICVAQTTFTSSWESQRRPDFHSAANLRCECNGRSRYCIRDAWGLRCLNCRGNTEGRHCERCKHGFHLQGEKPSCVPCGCNPAGSLSATCDSRGRCSCKEGVAGEKCDRCPDGPIGPNGCPQRRQPREDSGSLTLLCFCYGHSSRCSAGSGYSIHDITSTFSTGLDGWKVATVQGLTPHDVHFRWSPKHQDLEVISRHSLPPYLYAPDSYLGNQLLSYGQNFSFSLRLDRGVRHPSTNDVILEGASLRVSTSLGDLRSIVPCGQKISYSFRLDEQPSSRWRPQLSSFQFQKLLQNLTAIKIRGTFGENGRGYLDNVKLASAQRGDGVPARWVQTCSCPLGHEGEFCERCSAGFRRRVPADGAFSPCEPCRCRGGSCDPQTGDCYSADQTLSEQSCSEGFYRDPRQPETCVRCPCPDGESCSLSAGSLEPCCDRCPPGTTGPRCDVCQEGFYGDPAGSSGVQRPCRPCRCNGHIDVSVPGSCNRHSGECVRCVNNTTGPSCEDCVRGFYHDRPTDPCKPCNCDLLGSESDKCDDFGGCRCRPGFEGLKCYQSICPACFSPIKAKMEDYAARLKELETLFLHMDGGLKPADAAAMEAALKAVEMLVGDLQENANKLKEMERRLQGRLSSISRSQLAEGQDIQNIANMVDEVTQQQQTFGDKVTKVQKLTEEMRRKLDEAKTKLRLAEIPLSDGTPSPNLLSSLVQTSTTLADKHEKTADAVEQTANEALNDSETGLSLVRSLMNKENKVKELIGDLKTLYDEISARVKSLENQGSRLSDEARDESKMADSMLKDIADLERSIPSSVKEETVAMVTRLEEMKQAVKGNISAIEDLLDQNQQSQAAAEDLLAKGKAAQQEFNSLLDRVNTAKADTERALQRVNSTDELDDILRTLKDFDQQMVDSRALADATIKRLPGINATIQQAVSNNTQMQSVMANVSEVYNGALETINSLEDLVTGLGPTLASLPPHRSLLNDSSRLNREAKDLKKKADETAGDMASQLGDARQLEAEAEEAAAGASAALNKAKQTGDAVKKALRDVNNLLANMNETNVVDEKQLDQLEDSLADAQREVDNHLRPRLQDMLEQEDARRRQLAQIHLDIDSILADIANLEDILKAVPSGCFNSAPIEEA